MLPIITGMVLISVGRYWSYSFVAHLTIVAVTIALGAIVMVATARVTRRDCRGILAFAIAQAIAAISGVAQLAFVLGVSESNGDAWEAYFWLSFAAWPLTSISAGTLGSTTLSLVAERVFADTSFANRIAARRQFGLTCTAAMFVAGCLVYFYVFLALPALVAWQFLYMQGGLLRNMSSFIDAYEPLTARTASEYSE